MLDYLKILVMFLTLAGLPPVAFAGNGPQISFDRLNHDFGKVIHGTSPVTSFQVTNIGDEPLIIEKLRSSCGCARAIKGKRELAPGEKSVIEAKILTTGLKHGKHTKSIYVHSTDGRTPVAKIELKFSVFRSLSLDPPYLALSLLKPQDSANFTVRASNHLSRPICLKAGPPDKSGRQVTISPTNLLVQPDRAADFEIRIPTAGDNKRGFFTGTARLETDVPEEKTIEMRYIIQLPRKETPH